jgi:Domain of unknown function (DUF4328)
MTQPPQSARPDTLSRWTIVLLYCLMGLAAVAIVSDGLERKLLSDIAQGVYNGQHVLIDLADASDARQRAIGIVQIASFILSVIVIGRWTYKANEGARALGASGMTFTPGWSVGWYFVPFANLFKPYQAMREIWCASARPADWQSVTPPAKLGWWWSFWVGSNVLGNVSLRLSQGINGADDALMANAVAMLTDAVEFPLCLLLISIVREVAVNQSAARVAMTEQPMPQPFPPEHP